MSSSQEKYPKKITELFDYIFSVSQDGLYAITLTARCQSGKQIGLRGGEDLRIEIDDLKFREVPALANAQYQDIPPAWNGTQLKGLSKTVTFLLWLYQGEHIIKFIPRQGASIEKEPGIQLIQDPTSIKFDIEEQAEDGDRRPWYTFALINLPLQNLTANVTVGWHPLDSDDIKLIIDNKIKKNNLSLFHRNWLWSGSIFKKLLQKERQEKTFQEDLGKEVHYIEFRADRTPALHKVILDLGRVEPPQLIGWITDPKENIKEVNVRENASRIDKKSRIIGIIPIGEKVEILEERVEGDYVAAHSYIWHRIKYQNIEGYILSSYVDIAGKTRSDIQKLIINQSQEFDIDPEIVLALAECESHLKPYAVSEVGAKGVMQLTKKLLIDLNDPSKKFYSPVDDPFDIEQNIKGGIKYFKRLYNKYNGDRDRLRKTIVAYNSGPGNVPSGELLNLELYEMQTRRLVKCIETHLQNKTFRKIIQISQGSIFSIFMILLSLFVYEELIGPALTFIFETHAPRGAITQSEIVSYKPKQFIFKNPYENIKSVTINNIHPEPFIWFTQVMVETERRVSYRQLDGFLENAYLLNFDFHDSPELFIVRSQGNQIVTTILRYDDKEGALNPIYFIKQDKRKLTNLCCSYIVLKPQENGVQYDIAIQIPDYDNQTFHYIGKNELVYQYDFSNKVFYESRRTYFPYIPGG